MGIFLEVLRGGRRRVLPRLVEDTSLGDARAVAGIAEACAAWAKQGAIFHYVTASPRQLYEPLRELIRKSGFPDGLLERKHFRWKDSSFLTSSSRGVTTSFPSCVRFSRASQGGGSSLWGLRREGR